MITIVSLVLLNCNLIGASVSSTISLMPFEDVWTEATHACVFVIMLGVLRLFSIIVNVKYIKFLFRNFGQLFQNVCKISIL